MSVDMSPEAVAARLRQCSALSRDRRPGMRVDMSPEAVTRRLREVAQLRTFCLKLEAIGRANGLGAARDR